MSHPTHHRESISRAPDFPSIARAMLQRRFALPPNANSSKQYRRNRRRPTRRAHNYSLRAQMAHQL